MSISAKLIGPRRDLKSFAPEVFVVDSDFNARTDFGDLHELAKSIATNGYNQAFPVRGYLSQDKEHIVLVDGHRRLKAIQELLSQYTKTPLKLIPCIMEEKGVPPEERILTMFQSGTGKPLTPIEQAACIKRLLNFGWKTTEVAKKIGKSINQVSQLLDLNAASPALKKAIEKQAISTTAAIKLSKATLPQQEKLMEKLNALINDATPPNNKSSKKKPIKICIHEVEEATDGHATIITAKTIKDVLKLVDKAIEADPQTKTWRAVRYGLLLALGSTKFDPKFSV